MRIRALLVALLAAALLSAPAAAQTVPGEFFLVGSAARTTTGAGGDVASAYGGPNARCFLDVTAASGTTPNLVVDVLGVVNGQTYVLASFAAKTGVAKETITVASPPPTLRAGWTITGTTPSFTFSVICTRPG